MKSENRKKTILYVEQNQDGTVGGSYYSLLHMVRALDKTKYDAIVIFYEKLPIFEQFEIPGVNPVVFRKPLSKSFTPSSRILSLPYMLLRKVYNFIVVTLFSFCRYLIFLKQNKVDLVHLNNTASTGHDWLLACKILRKKCITHERGFAPFGCLSKRLAKRFDVIICISKAVEDHLHVNNLLNTCIIYNAIDVESFRKQARKSPYLIKRELRVVTCRPLIGMVGNFQAWKGQHVVVDAVRILKRKYPNILCLLIGSVSRVPEDKRYYERIKRLIQENGLEKNIRLTGYRSDIADLMNSLDILIHSSIRPEPFGRVIIEGMSLMKPVIATNMGGPAEIIDNGVSGLLIRPDDSTMLAESIDKILCDSELREMLGYRGLRRVQEKFSLKTFSRKINELYIKLM